MKKRYADKHVGGKVEKSEQKIIFVNDEYFTGDIYYYKFLEVMNKTFIPNGTCIIDNYYTWLEFYDYSTKIKLTAMYDQNFNIIEWYFDIAREIGKENGIPFEDDLYLDVVVTNNKKIILLDEDELQEALNEGKITKLEYDNAYNEANNLISKLENNIDKLKKFTDKYLNMISEL